MGILVNNKIKYDISEINAIGADINLIYGGRNIGKSYQFKKFVIEKTATKNSGMFAYVRRWDSDIKTIYTDSYFSDMGKVIKKATHGSWDMIKQKRGTGKFFYCRYGTDDEKEDIIWGHECGYIFALNLQERYKSLNYPGLIAVAYEEWLTDKRYLPDEPNQLLNLLSTLKRDIEHLPLYMIANTISRVNPYTEFFGLTNLMRQKQGTIDLYDFNTYTYDEQDNPIYIKIACQYCAETDDKKGNGLLKKIKSGNMIGRGEWKSEDVPHLDLQLSHYTIIHSVVFEYNNFRFLLRFLLDPATNNHMWYVERKTSTIKDGTRIVSNKFYNTHLYTKNFSGLTQKEKEAFSYLNNGHVVFCDNLTGAEFKQCVENFKY